jgi:hypothetical protein
MLQGVVIPNNFGVIKSRRMKWAGLVAYTEKIRNTHKMNEKTEGKRPLGRPGLTLSNNIKLNLRIFCVYVY